MQRLLIEFAARLLAGGLVTVLAVGSARAELLYRIDFTYDVRPDTLAAEWVTVDAMDLQLKPGMSGAAFVGDAGVNLVVARAGEYQNLVDFTLTTLPPAARVVSRQLLLDRGQPIEVLGLAYKGGREGRVVMRIRRTDGELECDFGSTEGVRNVDDYVSDLPFHGAPSMVNDSIVSVDTEVWYADPSAHFELHYIPNTLGDFGWNLVRDYLEKEFQQFDNVFHLYRAQRVNYFIAPCRVPEIAWVKNRAWAVEPTTFKAYAVFNRDEKQVSGIPTNVNYLYRYRGYAPLLLVEGAAHGFEYDHYYAKKLKWRGRLPRPSEHWRTVDYKRYPDTALAIAAGSFVNYLIGTRGLDEFFRLYTLADDLDPEPAFREVYDRGFLALEKDWLHFLDTMRVLPHIAAHFVSRSKLLGRNQESIELLGALIEVDTADVDLFREDLALLHFLEGEYDESLSALDDLSDRTKRKVRSKHLRNNALFFGGRVDSARIAYEATLADSANTPGIETAALMFGWLELTQGNDARAETLFTLVVERQGQMSLDHIEANLHRASIYRRSGRGDLADSLYRSALAATLGLLESRPGAADLYLRAGECYVGLGQADTAFIYLDVADFLEYRPYYVGRITVAFGNAYDLLGMRAHAEAYYRRTLSERTSYPARVAARKYLREPYRAPGA